MIHAEHRLGGVEVDELLDHLVDETARGQVELIEALGRRIEDQLAALAQRRGVVRCDDLSAVLLDDLLELLLLRAGRGALLALDLERLDQVVAHAREVDVAVVCGAPARFSEEAEREGVLGDFLPLVLKAPAHVKPLPRGGADGAGTRPPHPPRGAACWVVVRH